VKPLSDILVADNAKWKVRIMMHFLQKELTKIAKENGIFIPKDKSIMDIVHDDLRVCPNRGVRKIYKKIIEAGGHMKEHYQAATIIDLAPFVLWVAYHDTAYRDPLFWIADELVKDPEFREDIQPFVRKPADWYCPVWHDCKENTRTSRERGEINQFQLSPDEAMFVPERMFEKKDEMLKLQKDMEKEMRLKDRDTT